MEVNMISSENSLCLRSFISIHKRIWLFNYEHTEDQRQNQIHHVFLIHESSFCLTKRKKSCDLV